MYIKPMSTAELAVNAIRWGRNPDYVAKNYLANAATMRKSAERIKATGRKVGGYTYEECIASAEAAEYNAVHVPKVMRELTCK